MMGFKLKKLFLSFVLILSFCACSSKVQTNKIPNQKNFVLPKNTDTKELFIKDEDKKGFEESLRAFFKFKDKEEESLYDIGLKRGHFIQKDY
ncbi:hypothetical protein [Campylobacter cuniculorum]|uniref:hypothetical protein n=1 Tax=Campylobacter cuniculorum TaxID=374106 RepID=UPI0023F54E99|nr:hypothetical protein [Campylobacter cuniculorum]